MFDEVISEKWKAEMMVTEGVSVTQKMADFIVAELRFKAETKIENLIVFNGDVVKSDTAVPSFVKELLQEGARILEDIPDALNFCTAMEKGSSHLSWTRAKEYCRSSRSSVQKHIKVIRFKNLLIYQCHLEGPLSKYWPFSYQSEIQESV